MPENDAAAVTDAILSLVESSPHAAFVLAQDASIRMVNPAGEQLLGCSSDDLVGRTYGELAAGPDAQAHARLVTDIVRDPLSSNALPGDRLATCLHTADLRELPVDITLTPLEAADGPLTIATLHDATERAAAERNAAAQTRFYATLAETTRSMLDARDEASLFQGLCDTMVHHGGYYGAWVGMAVGGRILPVAHSPGLEPLLAELDLVTDPDDPRGRGPTAVAVRDGLPFWIPDVQSDPRVTYWHDVAKRYGIRSVAAMPLMRGDKPIAAMSLYSADPADVDEGMRELVSQVADTVSHALDNLSVSAMLREVAAHRADLMRRLVIAEEHERNRLADDIHDDAMQSLAALSFRLDLVKELVVKDPSQCETQFGVIRRLVDETMNSLREVMYGLESADLVATLEESVTIAADEIFADRLAWSVDADLGAAQLTPEVTIQAIRIAKEAMINVRRHARAQTASVAVSIADDLLEIAVSDDGVGLGSDAGTPRPGHRGQMSMRDRARALGGSVSIAPRRGGGTVVRAWLPVKI